MWTFLAEKELIFPPRTSSLPRKRTLRVSLCRRQDAASRRMEKSAFRIKKKWSAIKKLSESWTKRYSWLTCSSTSYKFQVSNSSSSSFNKRSTFRTGWTRTSTTQLKTSTKTTCSSAHPNSMPIKLLPRRDRDPKERYNIWMKVMKHFQKKTQVAQRFKVKQIRSKYSFSTRTSTRKSTPTIIWTEAAKTSPSPPSLSRRVHFPSFISDPL